MFARDATGSDRYNGDEGPNTPSHEDIAHNTTAVSSDWSVRPSDDTPADTTQTNSLSRLNPAAAPFSFSGGGSASGAAAGTDLLGGGQGVSGGLPHHRSGLLSNSSGDGSGGSLTNGSNLTGLNGRAGGGLGLDAGANPNALGMMQNMLSMPYMVGGGGLGAMGGRPSSMLDFGHAHPSAGTAAMGMGRMGGMSVGVGAGGVNAMAAGANSFLPPPGEDTDQQELLRLQQTNYRVKMLPPPLTYEVHRKMWAKNEYGDEDDDPHGMSTEMSVETAGEEDATQQQQLAFLANEDGIDKEQRLEAYKQIMLRWYSHIHVLEGKSEVAKRLVRVRRACPSMEEVITSLQHPQQQHQQPGATAGSDGGDDDTSPTSLSQRAPAAATRPRSPTEQPSTEEVLSTWSARCWDWWQETVKRKTRRTRKQGDLPLAAVGAVPTTTGLPTSASAPAVAALAGGTHTMGDGLPLPHSLSTRGLDLEVTSPHVNGSNGSNGTGSPFGRPSPYGNPGLGVGFRETTATAAMMPPARSYTSITDVSEEGGLDGAAGRPIGHTPQQQPPSQQPASRAGSYTIATPTQLQQQPSQASTLPGSHASTPPASMFTTNGLRAAAPRAGNPDDFLENDHLTLAFTTELLKSLED